MIIKKIPVLLVVLIAALAQLAQAQVTISNVYVSASTSSTATITWTTNVPSTSQVRYGFDISLPYNNNVDPSLVTQHAMTLKVLNPNQLYYFAAVSKNSAGQSAQSTISNFILCGSGDTGLNPMSATANNYYAYGSFTLTWVPPSGATASPTICGQPLVQTATGPLTGGSSFSSTVADAYKAIPGPGTWHIAVRDVGNIAPVAFDYPLSMVSNDVSKQLQQQANNSGLINCTVNTITGDYFPTGCKGGGGGGSPAGQLDIQGSNAAGTAFSVTGMKYSIDPANPFINSNVGFSKYSYNPQTIFPQSTSYYSHDTGCWSNQVKFGGPWSYACTALRFQSWGPGFNHGNSAYDPGWAVSQTQFIETTVGKNGIGQIGTFRLHSSKMGDNCGFCIYVDHKGGMNDNSSEGTSGITINLAEQQALSTYVAFMQATPNQPTTLTPATSTSYSNIPQSGSIIAQLKNAAGIPNPAITGCYLKNTASRTDIEVSGCTLIPAKHSCLVQDVINIPPNEPAGTQVSFKCKPNSFDSSPMEMTTRMLFGGAYNQPEPFYPISVSAVDGDGNQTITAIFHNAHAVAGWPIYDDVNYGNAWFDMTADHVVVGSAFWQTSLGYVVAGAIDATHLDVRSYSTFYTADPAAYQQSGLLPWRHRFPTTSGVTLTRASNVVTACGIPLNYSGQIVQIDASDNSFDGTFTFSNISNATNAYCATYAQTGADASSSGTAATGGEVGGTNGLGYVQLVPAAYIQYSNGVTTSVNGHQEISYGGAPLVLLPNNLSNTATYNAFINPFHNSISAVNMSMRQFSDGPLLRQNFYEAIMGGQSAVAFNVQNNTPYSQYVGGGGNGLLSPGSIINENGPISAFAVYKNPMTVNADAGLGYRFFSSVNDACNSAAAISCEDADIFEPRTPSTSNWHMDRYNRKLGVRFIQNNRFASNGIRFYATYYSGTDSYHTGSTGVTGNWYFDTPNTGACANSLETNSQGLTYRNPCRAPQPTADGLQTWNNTTKTWSVASDQGITQLTGDGSAGPGSGSQALTLATVNSTPGTCGDATHVCQATTNAKGLTTAQSSVAISFPSMGTTYSWTEATCAIGTTVGDSCTGSIHLPGAMPDASYQVTCTASYSAGSFNISVNSTTLPTTSGGAINITVGDTVTPGGAGPITPNAMCIARHP